MHINSTKINRQRLLISIVAWVPALAGMIVALSPVSQIELNWILLLFPWIALLVMTNGWIKGQRVHSFWPVAGLVTATLATLITFGAFLLLSSTAALLACYLVWFHLWALRSSAESS